jgi:hypothetical protein
LPFAPASLWLLPPFRFCFFALTGHSGEGQSRERQKVPLSLPLPFAPASFLSLFCFLSPLPRSSRSALRASSHRRAAALCVSLASPFPLSLLCAHTCPLAEDELDDSSRDAVENQARLLYGLVHARYIITSRGLAKMVSLCVPLPLLPLLS